MVSILGAEGSESEAESVEVTMSAGGRGKDRIPSPLHLEMTVLLTVPSVTKDVKVKS